MGALRIGIDLISEKGTPGGIHTYSNRLIEALASALPVPGEPNLELVVFAHEDYGWLFPSGSHPAIRIVGSGTRGLSGTGRRVLQQALVPLQARREGVHLVHSVNNVLPLALGLPAVVTVHDLAPFALPGRFSLAKRSFLRWAVPRSIRRARRVITDSEAVREDILRWVKGADPRRIAVVGLGADPGFSTAKDPAREAGIRSRYGLPPEFVLTVGAAEPGKNLPGITAAFSILEGEGISPPWVHAGAGTEELRRAAGPGRRGRGAGERRPLALGVVPADDLPHLYRMATIFLFPSLYEGFGLPVLEALSCGTPVVTSNRSSLPEVAGRAALRVNPERPPAIAAAVRRLWRSPALRARLGDRGPPRAAGFSWAEAARLTLAVYREVHGEGVAGGVGEKDGIRSSCRT